MSKIVFVTVGTTQFDNLVQTVTHNDIYKVGTVIYSSTALYYDMV